MKVLMIIDLVIFSILLQLAIAELGLLFFNQKEERDAQKRLERAKLRQINTTNMLKTIDEVISNELAAAVVSKDGIDKMFDLSHMDEVIRDLVRIVIKAIPADIISNNDTYMTEDEIFRYVQKQVFTLTTTTFLDYNNKFRNTEHPNTKISMKDRFQ